MTGKRKGVQENKKVNRGDSSLYSDDKEEQTE
jgi:hypothetical protein